MTTRQLMDEWGADRLKLAAAEARVRELEAAIGRVRQGFYNILELRRMPSGRYGNLTEDEIRLVIAELDEALKGGAK